MQVNRTHVLIALIGAAIILFIIFARRQKPLYILALGDSLTEGDYNHGQSHHPYAIHLKYLFESVNISVRINEQGVGGERVVPSMVQRLRSLLSKDAVYDWIIILGGTNDLGQGMSAEEIFQQGLKPMYEICLNYTQSKTKLIVMTVIENANNLLTEAKDKNRQSLNKMIRDYVANAEDKKRICLVDLDIGIPYYALKSTRERQRIWSDAIHLTPFGYDRMATLIFQAIKNRL